MDLLTADKGGCDYLYTIVFIIKLIPLPLKPLLLMQDFPTALFQIF